MFASSVDNFGINETVPIYLKCSFINLSTPIVLKVHNKPGVADCLARRHLTPSKKAMVAARLANMKEGRQPGNTANLQSISRADAAALFKSTHKKTRRCGRAYGG